LGTGLTRGLLEPGLVVVPTGPVARSLPRVLRGLPTEPTRGLLIPGLVVVAPPDPARIVEVAPRTNGLIPVGAAARTTTSEGGAAF
jgi:hypothetical protein